MLSFNDFNKKIHNQEYEIVKSRSGLPMFVLPNPLSQDDDEDSERELISREITTTEIEFDVEDETEEPTKKEKSLPQIVSDVITRMF